MLGPEGTRVGLPGVVLDRVMTRRSGTRKPGAGTSRIPSLVAFRVVKRIRASETFTSYALRFQHPQTDRRFRDSDAAMERRGDRATFQHPQTDRRFWNRQATSRGTPHPEWRPAPGRPLRPSSRAPGRPPFARGLLYHTRPSQIIRCSKTREICGSRCEHRSVHFRRLDAMNAGCGRSGHFQAARQNAPRADVPGVDLRRRPPWRRISSPLERWTSSSSPRSRHRGRHRLIDDLTPTRGAE